MAAEPETELDLEEDSLPGLTFSPPVYKQRYKTVGEIITSCQAKQVLDIGCAELKFLLYIKDACLTVEKAYGVDIDGDLVSRKKSLIEPLITDHLFKRDRPLNIAIFCGSVSEPDPSSIFSDLDVITLIEIIEHLEPDVLHHVPAAVFGYLHPKTVVVTTPNSEFNVLFENFTGFRHWDHKFEWSRSEFEQWCGDVARDYGYSVEYSGIGRGPEGTAHLGCCSQMAVFTRDSSSSQPIEAKTQLTLGVFKKIYEAVYAHTDDSMTLTEKITMETRYIIEMYFQDHDTADQSDDDFIAIELDRLIGFRSIKLLCNGSVDALRSSVRDSFRLSEDEMVIFYKRMQRPSPSVSASSSLSSLGGDVIHVPCCSCEEEEEVWD